MIDEKGYRLNIGIILANPEGNVLWARRTGTFDAWQFPQGGIHNNETLQEAMYRELFEELGLLPKDVEIIAESKQWLIYDLPPQYRRYHHKPLCIGQKQKWFLLRLVSHSDQICLETSPKPEFDQWRWVDYWYPLNNVISFKQDVYRKILQEFEVFLKS